MRLRVRYAVHRRADARRSPAVVDRDPHHVGRGVDARPAAPTAPSSTSSPTTTPTGCVRGHRRAPRRGARRHRAGGGGRARRAGSRSSGARSSGRWSTAWSSRPPPRPGWWASGWSAAGRPRPEARPGGVGRRRSAGLRRAPAGGPLLLPERTRWSRTASLMARSCATCSSVRRSKRWLRTPSTWPGAAAARAAKPSSVSTAIDPRRSVGHVSRRTQPASSSRATAWEMRLRDDCDRSASWLMRSVRSGASDSRTRIS